MLVKLPNNFLVGDEVENYLFFTNSHDGTSALTAGISNIRVVCNNTLQMAIKGADRIWRCKHTTNIEGKKQQAKEALGLAVKYMDKMGEVAEEMASKKISKDSFVLMLSDKLQEMNYNPKAEEQVTERILTIYDQKDDLQNFKGSAWGFYNATADLISNTLPLRRTSLYEQKKLEKFFDGNKLLNAVQDVLMVA